MPRIKRYFPVSHDINEDPEIWELTRLFGDRALRVWLELLCIFDKKENHLKWSDEAVATLSRKCRQSTAKVRRIVGHALAKGWLIIEESTVAKGWLIIEESTVTTSPSILSATNYLIYHRTKEPKKSLEGSENVPSDLPDRTDLPKEGEKAKTPARSAGPKRVRLTTDEFIEQLKIIPTYARLDIAQELGKLDVWLLKPQNQRKKKTIDRIVFWMNRALGDFPAAPEPKPKPRGEPMVTLTCQLCDTATIRMPMSEVEGLYSCGTCTEVKGGVARMKDHVLQS